MCSSVALAQWLHLLGAQCIFCIKSCEWTLEHCKNVAYKNSCLRDPSWRVEDFRDTSLRFVIKTKGEDTISGKWMKEKRRPEKELQETPVLKEYKQRFI